MAADPFAAAVAELSAERPIRSARLRRLVQRFRSEPVADLEQPLRTYLDANPADPDALNLLALTVLERGRPREAAGLLARCVEHAPDFDGARYRYAELLFTQNRFEAALEQLDALLADNRRNPLVLQFKAKVLESLGEYEQWRIILEELAREYPDRSDCWLLYGHPLRAAGRTEEGIVAYRKALELNSAFGPAYANLANLKTFRFSDAEARAMQELLKGTALAAEDRINLNFALGKVFEDKGEYARSFEHYAKANAAARQRFAYDADAIAAGVQSMKAAFTRGFFEQRKGGGCGARDPIFIVGRHRSGSTLIEQILASHPSIEGTAELPYLPDLVTEIADVEGPDGGSRYFEKIARLSPEELTRLGQQYLERARLHRKTDRPFFIDKNPGNHFHLGLIALILPNAKIIDARRNPAAACWSQFTHHFNVANLRLTELARAWLDYAGLMAHFDSALPGKVHRVIYEKLVGDTENEVRRLLDYLELPFGAQCLRFHENARAVLTPSSEQVRRPISSHAIDHWRHFEPWLGPMLTRLGAALTCYPDVPAELLPA